MPMPDADLSPTEASISIPEGLPRLDGSLSRAARVLLAMDVRARLTAEHPGVRLRMRSVYFHCALSERLPLGSFDSSKIPTGVCQVCARGALFLASIDRYNECRITEEMPGYRVGDVEFLVTTRTVKNFGEQAYEIEEAFEERSRMSAAHTMFTICENMIAGHGEFKPEQHQEFLRAMRPVRATSAAPAEASPEQ